MTPVPNTGPDWPPRPLSDEEAEENGLNCDTCLHDVCSWHDPARCKAAQIYAGWADGAPPMTHDADWNIMDAQIHEANEFFQELADAGMVLSLALASWPMPPLINAASSRKARRVYAESRCGRNAVTREDLKEAQTFFKELEALGLVLVQKPANYPAIH